MFFRSYIMKSFILLLLSLVPLFALSENNAEWVQINIPVACIRDGRGHSTEMTSQAVMGMPMRILENDGGEWLMLEAPDGYRGYVNVSSVVRKSESDMTAWRASQRLTVVSMPEVKVLSDTLNGMIRGNVVTELVNGSIVEGALGTGVYSHITLPDGRNGWVRTEDMMSTDKWADQPFDADAILDRCYYLMGTPYLWGACSTKSVDCSGLVRVAYYANGILTRRDAREQIAIGQRIEPEDTAGLRSGDLLFFSQTPDGRISHVAVYDNAGTYIHSSGQVKVNRMEASDPDFSARVYRGASRIEGMLDTDGITKVINHPWFF